MVDYLFSHHVLRETFIFTEYFFLFLKVSMCVAWIIDLHQNNGQESIVVPLELLLSHCQMSTPLHAPCCDTPLQFSALSYFTRSTCFFKVSQQEEKLTQSAPW